MNSSEDMHSRKNMKRRTARLVDDIALALAAEIDAILKDLPGMTLEKRLDRLPDLVGMFAKIRDLQSADAWARDCRLAVLSNPRLLDLSPGDAVHKVASRAGRLQRLLTPDRRTQVEQRREAAEEEQRRLRAGEFLRDLPSDYAIDPRVAVNKRKRLPEVPPTDPPAPQA